MTLRQRLPRLPPDTLLLTGLLLFIEVVYVFIVSAGHMTKWPTHMDYIDGQAEGFRSGHLHMAGEPNPALVEKPNPMDPAHSGLWRWDISLYKGHYYLYWGPVPSLIHTGMKILLRIKPTTMVGDQYVVFLLASLQAICGTLLLARLRRRLFPDVPRHYLVMAILAFAFINPTLYNLARAAVYESAIVGGHAFLVAGMLAAFSAVSHAASGAPRRAPLALAGGCWALALGCRISLAPAVALLTLATALALSLPYSERWRRFGRSSLWLGWPLAVGAAALLAFNRARFDRWFEFGRDLQLTWIPAKLAASSIPPNAYSYALRTIKFGCQFPYMFAPMGLGGAAYPKWMTLPRDHWSGSEQVIGMFWSPWLLLGLVAVVLAARSLWRIIRGRATWEPRSTGYLWAVTVFTIAGSVTLMTALTVVLATMRYLGDVAGSVALLAALGAWSLRHLVRNRTAALRWTAGSLCWLLAIASIAVGAAQGIEGQYHQFKLNNPELLGKLEKRLSVCGDRKP
jgi:hypothetical protein